MKIDKVTQAERKLAGLCQLCGAVDGPYGMYGPIAIGSDIDRDHPCQYKDMAFKDTSLQCLDSKHYDPVYSIYYDPTI